MTSGTPCRQQPVNTEVAVYVETTSRPNAAHDLPQTPNMPHDPTGPSTPSVLQTDPPTFLRNVGGSVVGGATPVRAESRHCPTDRDSTPNVPSDPLEKVDGSVRWHFSSLSPRSGLTHRSHLQLKQTPDLNNNDSTISMHCGGRTCQLASTLAHTQRSGHKHICDGGGSSTTTHLYQSDGSR